MKTTAVRSALSRSVFLEMLHFAVSVFSRWVKDVDTTMIERFGRDSSSATVGAALERHGAVIVEDYIDQSIARQVLSDLQVHFNSPVGSSTQEVDILAYARHPLVSVRSPN